MTEARSMLMTPIYAALAAERAQTAAYLRMVIQRHVTDPMLRDHLLGTAADIAEGRHVQDPHHLSAVQAAYESVWARDDSLADERREMAKRGLYPL